MQIYNKSFLSPQWNVFPKVIQEVKYSQSCKQSINVLVYLKNRAFPSV